MDQGRERCPFCQRAQEERPCLKRFVEESALRSRVPARMGITGDQGELRSGGNSAVAEQGSDRALLANLARRAMIERGLEPEFPPAARQELNAMVGAAPATPDLRDLRNLLWCSIDNDDSRDL